MTDCVENFIVAERNYIFARDKIKEYFGLKEMCGEFKVMLDCKWTIEKYIYTNFQEERLYIGKEFINEIVGCVNKGSYWLIMINYYDYDRMCDQNTYYVFSDKYRTKITYDVI